MVISNTDLSRLIFGNLDESVEKRAQGFDLDHANKVSSGLRKVASLPYKQEVYTSVVYIMKEAADTIDTLRSEVEVAKAKSSEIEKAAEVRKIIDEMIDFGIVNKDNVETKVASLMKKDKAGLEIVKEAFNMAKCHQNTNVFFEEDKVASHSHSTGRKAGMFDRVL